MATVGEASVRVTKSQIAFRHRKGFAFVVHPSAGTWMHHLELRRTAQVDDEVRGWLAEAHAHAG